MFAILLGSGVQGKDVRKFAKEIIALMDDELDRLTLDRLCTIHGLGHCQSLPDTRGIRANQMLPHSHQPMHHRCRQCLPGTYQIRRPLPGVFPHHHSRRSIAHHPDPHRFYRHTQSVFSPPSFRSLPMPSPTESQASSSPITTPRVHWNRAGRIYRSPSVPKRW